MLLGEFVPSPLTAADATTATTNNLATHPEGEAGQREEGQQIHQDSGGGGEGDEWHAAADAGTTIV